MKQCASEITSDEAKRKWVEGTRQASMSQPLPTGDAVRPVHAGPQNWLF